MSKAYTPTREYTANNDWACYDVTQSDPEYTLPCPLMMDCWSLNKETAVKFEQFVNNATVTEGSPGWKSFAAGDEVCQCGTIALLDPIGDNFPTCNEKGPNSGLPIALGFINIAVFLIVIGWGLWIVFALKKLKQFQFNPVTQALLLTIGGGVFGLIQQGVETAGMLVNDMGLHRAFYQPPGINSFCLAGIGACMVLSDFAIPLLWLQIASSGMNKAEAEARKKRSEKQVKWASIIFTVTFLAAFVVGGASLAGGYSILWVGFILVIFNVGGRKLRAKLHKPGEEPTKTIKDIMFYVRSITVCVIFYLVVTTMFVLSASTWNDNSPERWWLWALLVYHTLGQCLMLNTRYIRRSLDKKLKKFTENGGKVVPSTVVSSTAD
mmetsp:Transcript_24659/g.49030  ORF Transcript_24659/g.49030 Transcript_24659/m.49030 type:complete len:380 (-) Transcript_24659:1632-2771(-)|eukprot:CAMPEP_0182487216 /NCGR_PEP_ID=MMETSP1319-20130603/47792_1 /TAXON_ID=172717 /ORGANISM="Bolidomonas pacifica, Strain RCC208" /LENGTH=379 /DNA_ID=CAMNT_0024689331 /DNA_START=62 /DNA_END=1201 /DNA_ORIENTATION=-